jgi:A/G-specific adenine glycosylase
LQWAVIFLKTYKELLSQGVGDYTAAAMSFSYKRVPVVDGNVYRVLSRIYGIRSINSTPALKNLKRLLRLLVDINNPAIHNQAIMEFRRALQTRKSIL